MKPLHIHTRAQNHPDKQKSHKSRYMSRIGGCSPALAAITRRCHAIAKPDNKVGRWQLASIAYCETMSVEVFSVMLT